MNFVEAVKNSNDLSGELAIEVGSSFFVRLLSICCPSLALPSLTAHRPITAFRPVFRRNKASVPYKKVKNW